MGVNRFAAAASGVPAYPADYMHPPATSETDGLIRELIDEVRGLRADLRRERLRREVERLPAPIREGGE